MIDPAIAARIREDPYTAFLGATVEAIDLGYARASLTITAPMLNAHGITHGAIVFGLSDIALAAACNSYGQVTLAINITISYIRPTHAGDHLIAEAREVGAGGATAVYDIVVTDEKSEQVVAKCQAMVYRKREALLPPSQ